MDTSKIIAILNKADPWHNSNYQERKVALNMAHKAMDGQGVSYASLGYSQSDAERIENQFSVTNGHAGNAGSSHTGYHWWNPFSWGSEQAAQTEQAREGQPDNNSNAYNSSSSDSKYKSYNDPASPDYQYQVNYDESNNGYWDGVS